MILLRTLCTAGAANDNDDNDDDDNDDDDAVTVFFTGLMSHFQQSRSKTPAKVLHSPSTMYRMYVVTMATLSVHVAFCLCWQSYF